MRVRFSVRLGQASSPRRLVAQDHNACAGRLRAREAQLYVCAAAEQLRPAADEDRVDPEVELVEQISLEQCLADRAMTVEDDVLSILLLGARGPLERGPSG